MNTNYFRNTVMGNVFGCKTTPALPTEYYVGLSKGEPNIDGTFSGEGEIETDGTNYSREKITGLSEPENGVIKNTASIVFNTSDTEWGTVTHYVVYDSESGGNLLFYGLLDHSRHIEIYTSLVISAGALEISFNEE